jgi:hypothetical protein
MGMCVRLANLSSNVRQHLLPMTQRSILQPYQIAPILIAEKTKALKRSCTRGKSEINIYSFGVLGSWDRRSGGEASFHPHFKKIVRPSD